MGKNKFIVRGVAKKFIALDGGSNTSSIEVRSNEIEDYTQFFGLDQEYTLKFEDCIGKVKLEKRKKSPSLKWNTTVSKDNEQIWKKFISQYKSIYHNQNLNVSKFTKNIQLVFEKQNDEIHLFIDSSNLPILSQISLTGVTNLREDKVLDGKAEFISFSQLMRTDYVIEIPFYQRDYTWGVDSQVKELIEDIKYTIEYNLHDGDYSHFLGNIIMKENRLVDGQQRLTTLLLFYIAYNNLFGYDNNLFLIGNKIKINNKYLSRDIRKLINKEYLDDSIILKNYNAAYKWMHETIEKALFSAEDIYDFGLSNLILCVQYLPSSFDENMVYETINSRGVTISNYDLIKANFLNFNISDDDFNSYEDIIEEKNNLNSTINQDVLIDFYRNYIAIKTSKLYSKDTKSTKGETLYVGYKDYMLAKYRTITMNDEIFHQEFIELEKYKKAYNEMLEDKFNVPITGIYSWIRGVFKEYEPVLMELIKQKNDGSIQKYDFDEIITYFTKYVMYKMMNISTNRSYDFPRLAAYLTKQEKIGYGSFKSILNDKSVMTDSLVFNRFVNLDPEHAYTSTSQPASILSFLERVKEKEGTKEYKTTIHVEHIYPQTPTSEHSKIYGENIYNRIGNMLLLSAKLNSKVSNKILKDKLSDYKESEFITTKEFLNKYSSYAQYTEEMINNRSEIIIEDIKKVFN